MGAGVSPVFLVKTLILSLAVKVPHGLTIMYLC
jgi:hypothetical protein